MMCRDEAAYVRFAHATKDYLLIETIDAETRQPIPGAQYNVTKMDGDLWASIPPMTMVWSRLALCPRILCGQADHRSCRLFHLH